MKCKALFASILAALLISCSNNSSSSRADDVSVLSSEIPGFLQMNVVGKIVVLGTKDSSAKENERPQMKVSFDYDFAIGRSEVTCGEFNEVMGKADLPEGLITKVDCDDDSLPATNVSYYDAILFANAKSVIEGMDTAYSYQSIALDGRGHCKGLSGLSFRNDVRAFRLPTEAEWMFAANVKWDVARSWTSNNSDYRVHKVCELVSDPLRFCDLEGNVKEFVNDWLGLFSDTTVMNYVGAAKGDELGQRVLKGGSFKQGVDVAKPYHRGDDYVVTSSSYNDYIGFRLAYGAISSPTWMSGGLITSSNTVSLMGSAEMKKLVGTFQSKLVFRNNITGNLEYVDYSIGSSKVFEIADSLPAYHPDVSPDGQWVAFCTGIESISAQSDLYVRKLGSPSYGLVKLDVESAVIPRWRVTEDGDTVIVYVTDAGNNEDDGEFFSQSTWQVPFTNGTFGRPRKLFDGAYHGGVSSDNGFAVTGSRDLRVRKSNEKDHYDSVWYGGDQACNVSLSKDNSKRTLFLDFGSEIGQKFDGEEYGVHERILVMDSTGELISSIASPKKYGFDHSEWTNENKAIVSLTNINGVHEKIALVDMESKKISNLVKGDELWHPVLWIDPDHLEADDSIDLDSAGIYQSEDDSWGAVLMRYNMELLWRYYDSVNVAIVGSSRPLYSLSPSALSENFFAVNFAHTPNSIYSSRDFLNNYLFNHLKKLKYIVLSLDIDFWWKLDGKKGDNFFVNDVKQYPGYVYDANHEFWKDGVPAGLARATEKSLGAEFSYLYQMDRGRYLGSICSSWGDIPEVEVDSTMMDGRDYIDNSMVALESIIDEAEKRNVTVVGMIFPQNPAYRETGAFGRYGLRRSVAKSLIQKIDGLSKNHSNFVLMDENKMGDHDYTDEMAVDYDHLCGDGVPLITARLDSLLRQLEVKGKK